MIILRSKELTDIGLSVSPNWYLLVKGERCNWFTTPREFQLCVMTLTGGGGLWIGIYPTVFDFVKKNYPEELI